MCCVSCDVRRYRGEKGANRYVRNTCTYDGSKADSYLIGTHFLNDLQKPVSYDARAG